MNEAILGPFLRFFPKCKMFCATSWEVPWPLCARNRPPRYPGVSPDAGLPLLGTRTRSRTPPKRAFWGVQFYEQAQFFSRKLYFFGEPRLPIVLLHLGPTTNRNSAILVVQVPNGTHMRSLSDFSLLAVSGTEVVVMRECFGPGCLPAGALLSQS